MSNRNFWFIASLTAVLSLSAQSAPGQTRVALQSHSERVNIVGRTAVTTVSQVYVNYTNSNQEIVMKFQLPPGGAVSELAMWVGGLRSPAVFHPRIAARRIYRQIRNAQRDPALLEYLGSDTWRLSVFPILPKSTQKVEFKFTSVLGGTGADCVYRSMKVIGGTFKEAVSFKLAATLRCPGGIKDVKAIADALGVQRFKDRIELGFRGNNWKLDHPAAFAFTPEVKQSNVTVFKSPGGQKHYAAVLDPSWDAPKHERVGRNMVIVLDASASMKGEPFGIAATAVKTILDDLTDKDKFNVIVAASDVGLFNDNLQTASKSNKVKAVKWLTGFMPKGGTDLAAALRAVESLNKDTSKTLNVFLISDTKDCVGARKPGKEASPFLSKKASLPKRPPANCRFFICQAESESIIFEFLADSTGGASDYIYYDDSKESVRSVKRLLDRSRIPDSVTTVTIRQIVPGDSKKAKGRADLTDIGFSRPDPVNGMVVTGLWPGAGKRTIEVTLHRRGGTQSTRYVLNFPKAGDILPEAPDLRKVWAHQRADGMWAALHKKDVKLDGVRAFMNFSRTEGIVTRAMAMLVLESDDDYIQRGIKRPGSTVTIEQSLTQLSPSRLLAEIAKLPQENDDLFDGISPTDSKTITLQALELLRRGHIDAAADLFDEAADRAPGQFEARQQAALIGEYLALKKSFKANEIVRKSNDAVLKAVLEGAEWHELVMQTAATDLVLQDPNARADAVAPVLKPVATLLKRKPETKEHPDDKILSKKIAKVVLLDVSLKKALADLGKMANGIDVRWDKLEAEGIKPSTKISLTMTDTTLGEALSSMMGKITSKAKSASDRDWQRGLDFTIDKTGITVSSQRDIGVNADTRTYDIQDLIAYSLDEDLRRTEIDYESDSSTVQGSVRRNWPDDVFDVQVGDNSSGPVSSVVLASGSFSTTGDEPSVFDLADNSDPDAGWSSSESTGLFDPGAGGGYDDDLRSTREYISEIKSMLEDTVDRDSWRNAGGEAGAIKAVGGVLLITQTRANHRAIVNFLDSMRKAWRQRKSIRIDPALRDRVSFDRKEKPEDPFNAKGRINQWLIDLLKRAEAGKLSKFSSVKVEKIGARTFAMICGIWFDTSLTDACEIHVVALKSAAHNAVLKAKPAIEKYLALGKYVIVKANDTSAIYVNHNGISSPDNKELKKIIAALTKRPAGKR